MPRAGPRAPTPGVGPWVSLSRLPTPTAAPPADLGIPWPPGARRAGPPAGPRLPRPRCALRLGARPPPPLPLPSPSLSFLRSSLGPAAAAAASPGPRGPYRPLSPQHGTIGTGLTKSSIWGKQDLKGWAGGCPAASVMDVSKMVSEEQGLCPGPLPPTPAKHTLSPSQSALSTESFWIVDPACWPQLQACWRREPGQDSGGGWRLGWGSRFPAALPPGLPGRARWTPGSEGC